MNRLQRLALGKGPLDPCDSSAEVHARKVDVDELGGAIDHPDEVLDEPVTLLFVLW